MGKLVTTPNNNNSPNSLNSFSGLNGSNRSIDTLTIVGIFSAFLLLTLTMLYLNVPIIRTSAVEEASSAAATVESVASISVDPTVSLDITPSGSSGGSDVESFNVKVMTNSRTGYILKMAAEGSSSSMTSTTSSQTIASDFSGGDYSAGDSGKAVGSMGDNKWGFSVDGTSFFNVPVTGSEVTLVDTLSSTANVWNTHTYYFGAHATAGLEAGTYSKNVTFTAVAYSRAITFYDIDYMHEMSSSICTNTPTASSNSITEPTPNNTLAEAQTGNYIAQTTLTDYRDMKTYVVRKYSNGECWMAQNLETDFLASGDSVADGSSNTGTYATTETGKDTSAITDSTATLGGDIDTSTSNISKWLSYSDINDYDYFSTDGTDNTDGASAYNSGTFYATQNFSGSSYGWGETGRDGARSYSTPAYVEENPNATMKNYIIRDGTNEDGLYTFKESETADTTENGGGEWQRVGNYYNFAAAKAGYIGETTGTDPDNSICPRHWTLPTISGDKSFRSLISAYKGTYGTDWTDGSNNTDLYNWLNGHPLDFWRSGLYGRSSGNVVNRTTNGYWWSNKASGSGSANYLGTGINSSTGNIGSQSSSDRSNGLPIRCVAR